MNMGPFISSNDGSRMPARVEAAMRVLDMMNNIENPAQNLSGATPAGRELSAAEASTRAAALRLVQSYLNCEMDFGDAPPRSGRADNDGDMPAKVPA